MTLSVIKSGRGPEGITMSSSSIPASIRQQIIEDLIEEVRSGRIKPREPIPSAAQLMAAYKCSITPVRSAIDHLKTRGLLVGSAGRRVYVVDPLPDWMVALMPPAPNHPDG